MAHAHNTHTNGCGTKRSVVERFADHWAQTGGSRIEGLIAGYLLLDESDGVSAAQLSEELDISRGSVSNYIGVLVQRGFVHRVRKPGERTHYFVMSEDVWEGFLKIEQTYFENQKALALDALSLVSPSGKSWVRVRNMYDYMGWLIDANLPEAWQHFKQVRDGEQPPSEPRSVNPAR